MDEGRRTFIMKVAVFIIFLDEVENTRMPEREDVRRPAPTTTTTNLHLKRGCWLRKWAGSYT